MLLVVDARAASDNSCERSVCIYYKWAGTRGELNHEHIDTAVPRRKGSLAVGFIFYFYYSSEYIIYIINRYGELLFHVLRTISRFIVSLLWYCCCRLSLPDE